MHRGTRERRKHRGRLSGMVKQRPAKDPFQTMEDTAFLRSDAEKAVTVATGFEVPV